MGILYLVATPIGNLEDISIRAIKILTTVDAIACEDTRRAGTLLKSISEKFGRLVSADSVEQKKPYLISYYEQNELRRIPEILNALQNGLNVALISDAGTPAVSDPGFKLVRECVANEIKVESIPGASSVISALVVSGLPTDKFTFIGYPPRKPGHRKTLYQNIQNSQELLKSTIIMFESPHKLLTTLDDMLNVFGDIEIVTCHELTKIYESVRREKISEAIINFKKNKAKGEYVLLFHL